MNVVSYFDGMSCGQIALRKAGKKVDNYWAAEIDKYAIQVTKENFPNTKHIGDVEKVDLEQFPKIDLFIAGSPCQGFSFAGKQLNFDDPRSKLFFEYAKALRFFKEKNNSIKFMLENVKMKQEFQDIITDYLGVKPILINSSLVSAQSRERYYWTNINFEIPKDRGILLKDIVQENSEFELRQYERKKEIQISKNGLINVGSANIKGMDSIKRVYDVNGKCPTLTTMSGGHRQPKISVSDNEWRKLTPLECERAQTIPDNYTSLVSNSQRYKMLGNGWTVDVIAEIFKGLK